MPDKIEKPLACSPEDVDESAGERFRIRGGIGPSVPGPGPDVPLKRDKPVAATTWDEPRPYDRHRVGLAEAHGSIDDMRERLSVVMSRVPSGDAYQRLLDAKNSILTAQDLIRAELERSE